MNWYDPNYTEEKQKSEPEKKKSKRPARIAGIIVLAAIAAGAGILAFLNTDISFVTWSSSDNPAGFADGFAPAVEMPDDFKDFFSDFYTTTTTDSADVDIPLYDGKLDFKLELKKSGGDELSLQDIYDKCSPMIVSVSAFKDGQEGYSWGTGVIASEDGLIITNTHVVNGHDSAVIQTVDGTEYEAKLVGADAVCDLALLKIEPEEKLPVAEFADTTDLNEGDAVAAIGNPLGADFRNTLTNGIVSAIDRGLSYNGHSLTLIQTNTALNEGNSGGALFNMQGQVVGITNMKMMSYYSSIEGIGFAIPSTTVQSVVEDIMERGYVPRTSLGITVGPIPENARKAYDLPTGLYVSDVKKGSDAEKKGVTAGDVITAVNGKEVFSTTDVNVIKDTLSLGDEMTLSIFRKDTGESFDVNVELMDYRELYE